jgi:hypothetical protein
MFLDAVLSDTEPHSDMRPYSRAAGILQASREWPRIKKDERLKARI